MVSVSQILSVFDVFVGVSDIQMFRIMWVGIDVLLNDAVIKLIDGDDFFIQFD